MNKELKNTNRPTPEQQIESYYVEMLKNGIKTGNLDRELVKKNIAYLYDKYIGQKCPEIVFCDSKEAAIRDAMDRAKGKPCPIPPSEWKGIAINVWSWWVAFYYAGITFLKETAGLSQQLIDDLLTYEKIVKSTHILITFKQVCYAIEYPISVCIKDDDLDKFKLHNENDFAIKYRDNTGICVIDDIKVPNYIALTPAKDLDVKQVIAEENIDVRRVGLNKIGVDNVLNKINAKLLDRTKGKEDWDDYELVEVDLGDKKRKFLKMFNPEAKKFEFTRVTDNCTTVLEAQLARNNREKNYIKPSILT